MDNFTDRWSNFRPSKTLWLWSCAGVAALTMIVGFSMAGWVTASTAQARVATSTEHAVAQLAANICQHRFLAATDASAQVAALEATDSWKRDNFIEQGGWTTFANMTDPVNGAASLCARQILEVQAASAKTAGNGV